MKSIPDVDCGPRYTGTVWGIVGSLNECDDASGTAVGYPIGEGRIRVVAKMEQTEEAMRRALRQIETTLLIANHGAGPYDYPLEPWAEHLEGVRHMGNTL